MEKSENITEHNNVKVDGNKNQQKTTTNPPRAPLVLRIGVTGHRLEPDNISQEKRKRTVPNIGVIQTTIKEVLEVIQVSFKGVAETSDHLFDLMSTGVSQLGGGTLRIVSGLASGADQWVANEAIGLGFELQSILPFERDEFLKDFTVQSDAETYLDLLGKSNAILELDGKVGIDSANKRKPESLSYEAVGRALLNQADLLIAIWDGLPAQGQGGTGQVVNDALQCGIPVVWIPWNSPTEFQLYGPSWRLLKNPADTMGDKDRLTAMIQELLLPPAENHHGDVLGRNLRMEYFKEDQKHGNPQLGMWQLFRHLVCGTIFYQGGAKKVIEAFCVVNFEDAERIKSQEYWTMKSQTEELKYPFDEKIRTWVNERYSKHYAWANGLSMYYGDLHRSSFLLNYLFGALAVFLALVCIAKGISGKVQTGWILSELFVIIGILALTYRGHQKRWHQRWIDYRTLAERLRVARCLILLGGGSPQVVYEGHLTSYGNPSNTWMSWHYRAIERAAGIPSVLYTKDYLKSCQEFWRDRLIQGQIGYHKESFERFKKMDRRLHKTGDSLFIATLIACMIHLADIWLANDPRFNWMPDITGGVMTMFCAFLPALGAAFAAIRSHGELQRLAQRSKAMEETLSHLKLDLASVPITGHSLNSQKLRYQADRVSDLMTSEMLDWRVVFQDRPLGLPV